MDTATVIIRILDLVVATSMTAERVIELRAKIDQMRAEGREPTTAEWTALLDQIEADSARLDAAAQRA